MAYPLPRTPPRAAPSGRPRLAVSEYGGFAELSDSAAHLFDAAGETSFCLTRAWFERFAARFIEPGERLSLLTAAARPEADVLRALVIGRHRDRDRLAYGGRSFTSLDNLYSLAYGPLTDPSCAPKAVLGPLIAELRGRSPAYDLLRFQPLDPRHAGFAALWDCLRESGYAVQAYSQFETWFEPSAGLDFAGYLAARPAALHNTIRRKRRGLERAGRLACRVMDGEPGLDRAIADYERVYGAGWKAPEPEAAAAFIRDLVRVLAGAGALRLGILELDGAPIAAQIWILWHGVATVYKLAHDQRLDRHSPGTVLTALMIEQLLDRDHAGELNFGPGADPYKRAWAGRMREMQGILAFNRTTLRGRLGIARHIWGRGLKRALTRTGCF
jgi:hypothetical protein